MPYVYIDTIFAFYGYVDCFPHLYWLVGCLSMGFGLLLFGGSYMRVFGIFVFALVKFS